MIAAGGLVVSYGHVTSRNVLENILRLDRAGDVQTSLWLRVLGSEQSRPAMLRPSFERLAKLQALERDWDTYGALPLTLTALARAESMMRKVVELYGGAVGERAAPYTLMPIVDGGVSVEWQGAQADLELDIGPDGALSYLLIDRTGDERRFQEGVDLTDQQALELVRRVIGG